MNDKDKVAGQTNPEQGMAKAKRGLPELELIEIAKSKQKIGKDTKVILPWNNYTIILKKDSKLLEIIDENGQNVSVDKDSNKLSIETVIDWTEIYDFKNTRADVYLGNVPKGAQGVPARLDLLPAGLKEYAETLIALNRPRIASWSSYHGTLTPDNERVTFGDQQASVYADGKYIVFFNFDKKLFLAFETTNEAGITQAPKDWIRRRPADFKCPAELIKIAGQVLERQGLRDVNEEYSAIVTDVGINMVPNDNPKVKPVFSEKIPGVGNNIAIDPKNSNVIYFCKSTSPGEINRLDMSGAPDTWNPSSATLPNRYESVSNLQLDPSGQFFIFYSKEDLVIISRDSLTEVKKVPGLTHVNFDSDGRIRGIDKDGFLVIYEPKFDKLAEVLEESRIERLTEGLKEIDVFKVQEKTSTGESIPPEQQDHLKKLRDQQMVQLKGVLDQATSVDQIKGIRAQFGQLRKVLETEGLKDVEIRFVLDGLDPLLVTKEKSITLQKSKELVTLVRNRLDAGLSFAAVSEAKGAAISLKAMEGWLDEVERTEVQKIVEEFEQKSTQLFRERGKEIVHDVEALLKRTEETLAGYTSKMQFDDWLEFRMPQLNQRLAQLANDCPIEADDAFKAITEARAKLRKIADEYERKFKLEYAKVREKASERMEAVVETLEHDIDALVERLRTKNFQTREDAEAYLSTSEARKALETEITGLVGDSPDLAKELRKMLSVRTSKVLSEVERGGLVTVATTGQQMIRLGEAVFPKWEAKVEKKLAKPEVNLTFESDKGTHGPGISPSQVYGDVSLILTDQFGKTMKVRLYEGLDDEDEWKLGLQAYRGKPIPPSYLRAEQFLDLKKDYTDWQKDNSKLRAEISEKWEKLRALYKERAKPGKRVAAEDEVWQEKYNKALEDYADYYSKHHISILRRIDGARDNFKGVADKNGKGFVPEWQSHWVVDTQTEADLADMARYLKMQLDLQEGLLNLKGHAGTGKDVRVKMFANLTGRPYFAIDCTKWTTEFELSEDVVLEAENGASQTIKVPSAVLNGINTPGAIVYFNEMNAMPEQAQIFLHSLMDEKRSLTLKTSSGKVVRANSSVLLIGSMNPGYPGTFDPQFATRSRMVSLEIGYPPVTREADPKDKNRNPVFDVSEPLRIAREVESLTSLTYEASLERNEFVKLWNSYVNGMKTGAPEPSTIQKFDLDTILALVQFGDKLRQDFVKTFEKTRDSRSALPVRQPLTGRELRRCAYMLNEIPQAEKIKKNPEVVAKELLAEFFLSHIDEQKDVEAIKNAMQTWTSKKRVG